jgi:hypothetical protein
MTAIQTDLTEFNVKKKSYTYKHTVRFKTHDFIILFTKIDNMFGLDHNQAIITTISQKIRCSKVKFKLVICDPHMTYKVVTG